MTNKLSILNVKCIRKCNNTQLWKSRNSNVLQKNKLEKLIDSPQHVQANEANVFKVQTEYIIKCNYNNRERCWELANWSAL